MTDSERIEVIEHDLAYLAQALEVGFELQGLPAMAKRAKKVKDYYERIIDERINQQ